MTLLYRIQQHAALTRLELNTAATLVLLFLVGMATRHFRETSAPPVSPRLLLAAHTDFARRSAVPDAALAPARDSVRTASALATAAEAQVADSLAALPGAVPAEAEARAPRRAKKALFTGTVHLNTATSAQLQLLPRVGPKLADRILAYRAAHGGRFRSVDELNEVKGVGDKTLATLRPHLAL